MNSSENCLWRIFSAKQTILYILDLDLILEKSRIDLIIKLVLEKMINKNDTGEVK